MGKGGNLVETLLRPDIKIGTSTPKADPAGDYTWELFHRIDAGHVGAFDTLSNAAVGNPVQAALDDRTVDLFVYYCSGARQLVSVSPQYRMVGLPPELMVGPGTG